MAASLMKKKSGIPSLPKKVLVLGGVTFARLIAEELAKDGFEVFLQALSASSPSLRLPALSDPDGLAKITAILLDFVQKHSDGGKTLCYVHPGASIWGERPELPSLAQELGLQVICPPARVLSLFGNKLSFFAEAEKLGIPNLLLSPDPMHSLREIEQRRFSYPLVLKAVKGGLTAGHYVVHDLEELRTGFSLWMEQVRNNSGEVIVLAEKYLEGARHLVVPFVRFQDGRFESFPMIDASLQCRHRKMVEFCPAHGVDRVSGQLMMDWTRALASSCGFVGVGTLEFLVDSSRPFLIGGFARLNKSFRIWEKVAGTQAVSWQVAAFEGRSEKECETLRPQSPDRRWANAVAIRLYAEDPILQLPQPGFVQEVSQKRSWKFPTAEAVLDLAVDSGEAVSPFSSGLLGILRVGAQDVQQLPIVIRGVLDEIWIAGSLQTNERFIAELADHPWIREGIFHAGFVDEEFLPAIRPPKELLPVFAGICSLLPEPVGAARWAVGDQWVKLVDDSFQWKEGPHFWTHVEGGVTGKGISGMVEIRGGRKLRVCAFPIREGKWQVRLGNWILAVRRALSGPAGAKKARSGILALVPGRIHSILFQAGAVVPAHEPLLMIESLGILVPHALPVDVSIQRWKVSAEDLVQAGDELADFDLANKS